MKILMLVPFLPNINTSGGQTRWHNIIKYLSKDHEITLFTLIKDDAEKRFIPELEKYCKKVCVFNRPKSPWTVRNLLLSAFSWYPLLVIRNFSLGEKRAIKQELASEDYDLIHAETFYVMPHLPKTSVPSILVDQTIEYLVYKHYVDNEVLPFLKPFFMADVLKLRFWEKFFWRKTGRLVSVSEEDKKVMQKEIPGIEVDVIPNGIDSDYFIQKKVQKKDPPRVLYGVANFKWLQNVEAVDILINQVWPEIIKKVPHARLWIVGSQVPKRILDIAERREDIEVTESIPDKRDALKAASVMVAPIRGPGGTRLKVLEAMAAGLPVVSTTLGVAGLNVEGNKQVLIADDNIGLANQVVRLLNDLNLAGKIGQEGQKHVKKYYDWKSIVKLHDAIYQDALKRKEHEEKA